MDRKKSNLASDVYVVENRNARPEPAHVLLAEDDSEFRSILSSALRARGYLVTECADGLELAINVAPAGSVEGEQEYDLVISDIRMPGMFGLSVLEGLHQLDDAPPVILITAFGDEETHAHANELGAAAVLDKPFHIRDLLAKVDEILDSD